MKKNARILGIPTISFVKVLRGLYLPGLFACFYESVSCVYAAFSTYLCTCDARAACFVFCSISLTALLFSFSFSTNLIDTYVTVPIDVRISLRICLKYFSHFHLHFSNSCVCVSKHVYAFPSSPILIHIYTIFISMICVLLSSYHHLFVFFLLFL